MFQLLALSVALTGSVIASYWDLKTTEVPDKLPYAMGLIGVLIYLFQSLFTNDIQPLLDSVITGTFMFIYGYVFYHWQNERGSFAVCLES